MNKELKNNLDFTMAVTLETFHYKSIHVTEAASPVTPVNLSFLSAKFRS